MLLVRYQLYKSQDHCNLCQSAKHKSETLVFHFDAGLEDRLKTLASKRTMKDDTIGPVITWTTEAMLGHKDKLLKIPGML